MEASIAWYCIGLPRFTTIERLHCPFCRAGGLHEDDIIDALPCISDKTACSPVEAVDAAFKPRRRMVSPFNKGRLGYGSFAVYYSAIEKATCQNENAYHLSVEDDQQLHNPNRRYY